MTHPDPDPHDSFQGLSWSRKLIRCYFRAVEALLDRDLIDHVLIDSYLRFKDHGEPYPFVHTGELKPGGVGKMGENALHNSALVILLEDELLPELKTNIRARRLQEMVQKNLQRYLLTSDIPQEKISLIREIESRSSLKILRPLLSFDYGLLIQRRPRGRKGRLNYGLTHFHVKIDEVLDRMIEALGLGSRYLSKNLFEQGEEYASLLEEKFYELCGMKSTAGGRRTAAIVAHHLLLRNPGLHAVYVGSTEARSLIKIDKDHCLARMVLVEIDTEILDSLIKPHGLTRKFLRENYFLSSSDPAVAVLAVHYRPTAHARPPADRKLRHEIKTSERWISIVKQLLMPLPSSADAAPLPVSLIYKASKG